MPLLSRVSALAGHWPATWPLPVELCHPWVELHPGMGAAAWFIFRVEWACWPVPSCTIPYLSWTGCFCFWLSGSKEKQETGSQKAATGMFWHEGEPVPSPQHFLPRHFDSTPALYQNLEWIPTSLSLRPPLWGWSWGCCLGRCKSLIDPGWVGAARRQRETLDWLRFLHDFQMIFRPKKYGVSIPATPCQPCPSPLSWSKCRAGWVCVPHIDWHRCPGNKKWMSLKQISCNWRSKLRSDSSKKTKKLRNKLDLKWMFG